MSYISRQCISDALKKTDNNASMILRHNKFQLLSSPNEVAGTQSTVNKVMTNEGANNHKTEQSKLIIQYKASPFMEFSK